MRLIDADKLDFSIVKYLGEFCHVPLDDIIRGWKKIVDRQPTAYDVDKVVERLEEMREMVPVNRLLDDIIKDKPKELGQLMAYRKAIEIVKSGGIEGSQ